jgi:hypothetical protein
LAIGRFFKSLVNAEVMGEEIVRSIIHLYEQTARYNPGDSTHDLLLKTYLARLEARRININDERIVLSAMADIKLPAQLPEGKNIKALALYCLFKERPDIIEAYPKFNAEYERIMGPILENSNFDNEDIDPLASSYETTSMEPEPKFVQSTSEDATIQEAKAKPKAKTSIKAESTTSAHKLTVSHLTAFVLESKTIRPSITTHKQMIDTLNELPQFGRLPAEHQSEVLNIVENEYSKLTVEYNRFVERIDLYAAKEEFKEVTGERMFSMIRRLDSFANLSEYEQEELYLDVLIKFPD